LASSIVILNNLALAKNKKGKEKLKPGPIANYNKFIRVIDRIHYYTDE